MNTFLSKVAGHILPDYGGSSHQGLPLELQLLFVTFIDKLDRPIPPSLRSVSAEGTHLVIGHAQHVKATDYKLIPH
eukprot:7784344-Prorocentrum_lima.AAC.1